MAATGSAVGVLSAGRHPFNNRSIWTVPIGGGATFQAFATGNETARLRDTTNAYSWVGPDATQGIRVFYARPDNKLVPWALRAYAKQPTEKYPFLADGTYNPGGPNMPGNWYDATTVYLPTPSDFTPSFANDPAQFDRPTALILPNGRDFVEAFLPLVEYDGNGEISRVNLLSDNAGFHFGSLHDQGFPNDPTNPARHEGIRAPGLSILGGMVRGWEVAYGSINHAIAIVLSNEQLKAPPTTGTDAQKQAAQCVWPAYHADGDSLYAYTGNIPMGSLFAIPKTTNLATLGFATAAGMMLAKAMQNYGAYVVDRAGGTCTLANLEYSVPQSFYDQLYANNQADLLKIRNAMALVTNNVSSATSAGTGLGLSYPIPVGGG